MQHVGIFCGGSSYEHDVSIITGIQVAEAIDPKKFTYSFIYLDTDNNLYLIDGFKSRKDFHTKKRVPVSFVRKDGKTVLRTTSLFSRSITLDVAYLAFHGGVGESGPFQGLLETLKVPFTSPSAEASGVVMNKALTKEVLRSHTLPVLPSVSVLSVEYREHKASVLQRVQAELTLPVIIKPVHLGSSIGIEIAHTEVELEKFLAVATRLDSEVLLEPALSDFTEYNVSLRSNRGSIQLSPIEEPKREDDILSFDDKYTKGGKKHGTKVGGGMELLDRTVPAQIDNALAEEINTLATTIFKTLRLTGVVRIDFMHHENTLYCTEINPIPGSMSFYLWEAAGEDFRTQITHVLEDSLQRAESTVEVVPYETDIVEKFIAQLK